MMHLAFPNVLGDGTFIGCGRYLSLPPGHEVPEPSYRLAKPHDGNIADLLRAARSLAPEVKPGYPRVYEQVTRQQHLYQGPSLDLAYLLAAIRCGRRLRLETLGLSGDIWCTGTIVQHGREFYLRLVDYDGFGVKLQAFLSLAQDPYKPHPPMGRAGEDRVFFVPRLNFDFRPEYAAWCTAAATRVLSRREFADKLPPVPPHVEWSSKMVVTIDDDELPQLVNTLFERPRSFGSFARRPFQERSRPPEGSMESVGSTVANNVVKVLASPDTGIASGAAFFISPTHLLTCYHVIRPVGAREVWVRVPGGSVCLAQVVEEYSSPVHLDDYAVLQIQDPQESFLERVALLDTEWEVNDEVAACGFQYENELSGSPLVNVRTGGVVGIASLELGSADSTALGTPTAVILRAHPALAAINLHAVATAAAVDYRRVLLGRVAELTLLNKTLRLDQVYVSLRLLKGYRDTTASLSADSLKHVEKLHGYLRGSKKSADWEIDEVRHLQTLQRRREERSELLITIEEAFSLGRVVVLGSPGSGKTTLLKHLALSLAHGRFGDRFPIFVTLNDYARFEETTSGGLLEYLIAKGGTKVLRRVIRRLLEEGRCCVMLDALDEIVQAPQRARVATHIRELASMFTGNIWVVTSRKVGFRPEWFRDFQLVEVKELEIADIERLVANWLGSTNAHLTAALVSIIHMNNRLLAFATNPLLLSFLVLVYEEAAGRLPQARAELYGAMIDLLAIFAQPPKM